MIINLFNQEKSVTNLTALWGSNIVKNKIIKIKMIPWLQAICNA